MRAHAFTELSIFLSIDFGTKLFLQTSRVDPLGLSFSPCFLGVVVVATVILCVLLILALGFLDFLLLIFFGSGLSVSSFKDDMNNLDILFQVVFVPVLNISVIEPRRLSFELSLLMCEVLNSPDEWSSCSFGCIILDVFDVLFDDRLCLCSVGAGVIIVEEFRKFSAPDR